QTFCTRTKVHGSPLSKSGRQAILVGIAGNGKVNGCHHVVYRLSIRAAVRLHGDLPIEQSDHREVSSRQPASLLVPGSPIRRAAVSRHRKKPNSNSLLQFRETAGAEFWTKRIDDPEALKTRQAEYNESVPTDSRVIFYESMSGARMMDSPYALFLHLYHEPAYRGYHHVWSVRSSALVPNEFKDDPRTTFVTRGTDAHLYFLAKAGYIIGNSLLPDHFVRKEDQKYLNTWHGIAYK